MWVCNHKYTEETSYGDKKCKVANLRQEWIEQGYLYAINQLLAVRSEITAKYERKLARINRRLESGAIEKELAELEKLGNELEGRNAELEAEFEFSFGNHDEQNRRKQELKLQAREYIIRIDTLEAEREQLGNEKKQLQTFIKKLNSLPSEVTRFRNDDFIKTIERIDVSRFILTYNFYGGEHIKVNINYLKKPM